MCVCNLTYLLHIIVFQLKKKNTYSKMTSFWFYDTKQDAILDLIIILISGPNDVVLVSS